MEIFWYGHSCFRFTERGMATVVTDPYDHQQAGYEPLRVKADIVTISHDTAGHNYLQAVKGDYRVIRGPGEYEIGGVFITGVQTNGVSKKEKSETPNTLYVIDYNGLTIAHFGDLNRVPPQSEIEALGTINVALVPVGGGGGLNADRAAEVVSLVEPNIVIPMHYATETSKPKLDSLNKFMKAMGVSEKIAPVPSLKITSGNLEEEMRIIVMDYLKATKAEG